MADLPKMGGHFVYSILISLLLLPIEASIPQDYSTTEFIALSSFFNITNGVNWKTKTGWEILLNKSATMTNPCDPDPWFGVACVVVDNVSHVKEISLFENNLNAQQFPGKDLGMLAYLNNLDLSNSAEYVENGNEIVGDMGDLCQLSPTIRKLTLSYLSMAGNIPTCVGNVLDSLITLILDNNRISGSTPDSVCLLRSLKTLSLANNMLSGSIPQCIARCSDLTTIKYADSNATVSVYQSLSGTLPSSLCNLTHLVTLDCTSTGIGGSIPNCLGTRQFSLAQLQLAHNSLMGTFPVSICDAVDLTNLNLESNALVGSLPDCYGTDFLPSLNVLNLASNAFTGIIPGSFSQLGALLSLDLSFNLLSGGLVNNLCHIPYLQILNLQFNQLTGQIHSCFGKVNTLSSIDIDSNQLTGSLPESFCDLRGLVSLNLFNNSLTGTLPACLGSVETLLDLIFEVNNFGGPIPDTFCSLSRLEQLNLKENVLESTIPDCLGSLSSLKWFVVNQNQLSGTIPDTLCKLTSLQQFRLSDNSFTGTIPGCLGSISSLEYVSLEMNEIRGSLPDSLCNLTHIIYLELFDNQLTGSIPNCFATSFIDLQLLLLHDNLLTGYLPSKWSLGDLQVLALSNNLHLKGILSESIFHQSAQIGSLRQVIIEGTRISGSIPSSVCDAKELTSLFLSGNRLQGSLPPCMCYLKQLQYFRASSNKISGKLLHNMTQMVSLAQLDLSDNSLSGTVPHSLGAISDQLTETSLVLNHLSCDLPISVLQWEKAADFKSLHLLEGNHFGCPVKGLFGLSMVSSRSTGLVKANRKSAQYYSCGGSAFVIPVIIPISILIILLVLFLVCWYRGFGGFEYGYYFFSINPQLFSIPYMYEAYLEIRIISVCTIVVGCIGTFVVLPVMLDSQSYYTCQYLSGPSLVGKHSNNDRLNIVITFATIVCLVVGTFPWWKLYVRLIYNKAVYSNENDQGDSKISLDYSSVRYVSTSENSMISLRETLVDADTMAEWQLRKTVDSDDSLRMERGQSLPRAKNRDWSLFCSLHIHAFNLLAFVVILCVTLGPNVLYVIVTLGNYSYGTKMFCTVALALFKVILISFLIPITSDKLSVAVFPTLKPGQRFRHYLNITVILAAISFVLVPLVIVLVTDSRCFYDNTQDPVTTDVNYETCDVFSTRGQCVHYSENTVQSTYQPKFKYIGDQCASAILSTYVPVILAATMLLAPLAAALDLLIVPLVSPWCHRHQHSHRMARIVLTLLRQATWHVSCVLGSQASSHEEFAAIVRGVDIALLARSVVRKAFVQLSSTLLTALTFGLAAPVIGAACVVASLIQFKHHTLVLSQVVDLIELMDRPEVPNITQCSSIPKFCSFTITITMCAFWLFFDYSILKIWTWLYFILTAALIVSVLLLFYTCTALISCLRCFGRCWRRLCAFGSKEGDELRSSSSLKQLVVVEESLFESED